MDLRCYSTMIKNGKRKKMSELKEQLAQFFAHCEEIEKCKFIMATAKIKDLLKCIVNSPDIYGLFATVTKNFDYPYVKSKCLVTVNDGTFSRSYLVMPNTLGSRLAFSFCLLVEFDKESVNFNDFLRKYFPEDGSYYASYHAFCNTVIAALADAVAQVYKDELQKPDLISQNPAPQPPVQQNPARPQDSRASTLISSVCLQISAEMQYISETQEVPDGEKEGGIAMLARLSDAVKTLDAGLMNALICGYNYFVLYYNAVSPNLRAIIDGIAELEICI